MGNKYRITVALSLAFLVVGVGRHSSAQDTRTVTEPTFPAACSVIAAPLQSTSSFITASGETVAQIDTESAYESQTITNALASCPSGKAVELSLGSTVAYNSFLINPITIPAGVSLIVDGGVTVYGTLDVANYQVSSVGSSVCGVPGQHGGGCQNLLTFSGNGGLYGYGVIDGRGYGTLMCSSTGSSHNCSYAIGKNFWYLTTTYSSTTNSACAPIACYTQNAPNLIGSSGNNFTIYKITLRNTPLWNLNIGGNDITIWGLKEQTTWAVANTDGMDLNGSDITVTNSTLSGGDDAIAIGAYGDVGAYGWGSSNITINNLTLYSRNGISTSTALEWGITNVLIENSNLTGDVPSVAGTTVNGVTQAQMATVNGVSTGITSYTAALPATMGDTRGINIKNSVYGTPQGANGNHVTNYQFSNICLQDVDAPITLSPGDPGTDGIYHYPTLTNIQYSNIHVLTPSAQFAGFNGGLYIPEFKGYPASTTTPNDVHLNNVVFDDLASGKRAIGSLYAWQDNFTNTGNVYPPALNLFSAGGGADTGYHDPDGNLYLDMNTVQTLQKSATSTPTPSLSCPASNWPFLIGDLYASIGGPTATGAKTNLTSVTSGGSITLNAMIEPATGQVEYFTGSSLDTGAPALTQPVQFYDGSTQVGTAALSANGTLASLTLNALSPGTHTFTARYPADTYYATYNFGSVTVQVPSITSTTTISTATSIAYGTESNITVNVTSSGPTPTGTVSIYDGSSMLATQTLSSGSATLSLLLNAGSNSLTAQYSGDGFNLSSTSTALGVAVAQASTTISVTPSTATTNQFQVVTYTATLPGVAFAATPTGTVTFTDGAATLGTVAVNNGTATLSAPMVNLGSRTIVATYSGDTNYLTTNGSTTVTVGSPLVTGACFAAQ